jgi:hypothetical protein
MRASRIRALITFHIKLGSPFFFYSRQASLNGRKIFTFGRNERATHAWNDGSYGKEVIMDGSDPYAQPRGTSFKHGQMIRAITRKFHKPPHRYIKP